MTAQANIGVIGLAAMGSNLARNLAHHGNTVALFNRHYSRTEKLMAEHGTEGNFVPAKTMEEFAASLQRPRTAIIMVKAGAPTDAVIKQLEEVFEPGDIIVDGGNSYFKDTIKREKEVRAAGFLLQRHHQARKGSTRCRIPLRWMRRVRWRGRRAERPVPYAGRHRGVVEDPRTDS